MRSSHFLTCILSTSFFLTAMQTEAMADKKHKSHSASSSCGCDCSPSNLTPWHGYPPAIAKAKALDAPGTLPNVKGRVYSFPMVNPGPDFDPDQFTVIETGITVPIKVLVPESYSKKCNKRYPVVYFYDGQWAFDDFTSDTRPYTKSEIEIDEMLANTSVKKALKHGIGEFILVAIPNQYTQADPNRNFRSTLFDYFVDPTLSVLAAQVSFLTETVKPNIDAVFRTLPDREHTILSGASAGGNFVGRVMFLKPEFASKYIIRSAVGYNAVSPYYAANGLPDSVSAWDDTNLAKVMNSGGMKVYYQYGIDSIEGLNLTYKTTAIIDENYLISHGFTLYNGNNFDSPFLLIKETLPGRYGDTHNFLAEGPCFIDGLLRVYGQESLDHDKPFYLPTEPSKLRAPKIIGKPKATSVKLRLHLPKNLGYNYDNTDMALLDIQEYTVFVGTVDPVTKAVTYDDGTVIDSTTLANTDPSLYKGAIREPYVNLVETTDLEWTVTGLTPNTSYVFKVCASNTFSICTDQLSNASEQIKTKHH